MDATVKTSHCTHGPPANPSRASVPTVSAPSPKHMTKHPLGVTSATTSSQRPAASHIHHSTARDYYIAAETVRQAASRTSRRPAAALRSASPGAREKRLLRGAKRRVL